MQAPGMVLMQTARARRRHGALVLAPALDCPHLTDSLAFGHMQTKLKISGAQLLTLSQPVGSAACKSVAGCASPSVASPAAFPGASKPAIGGIAGALQPPAMGALAGAPSCTRVVHAYALHLARSCGSLDASLRVLLLARAWCVWRPHVRKHVASRSE